MVQESSKSAQVWRHGDVLIASIESLPKGAHMRNSLVLVRGEITGHSHRIEDGNTGRVWEYGGEIYLKVAATARLIHEEHHPITLPAGLYRVWQQREYTPQSIRRVVD